MPHTALTLNQLLAQAVALQASDLHLSAGRAPMMRHDGALVTLEATTPTPHVLTHDALRMMLTPLMDEAQHAQRCSNGRSHGGCV
jgi:Tfp pilus assembly pilus retraction ATPase PilT